MIFTEIDDFLNYFEKVRKRTKRIIKCIPPQQVDWTYQEGKFTFGDLIRHLATIERYMYAENAQFKPSLYAGCGKDLAASYEDSIAFMDQLHDESMAIFKQITSEQLQQKCTTPGGTPITLWKWLRLMAEHEIHHRGQIYLYLSLLDIPTPPLYGMTAEEVEAARGNT
ncbi:MAG: DinB family protein [Flammeovirgaceae bacterium]